ncbi:MAG TPA: cupin domain-containing protein [Gaiellaceae bacterium]
MDGILLRPGEGETITDRAERTIRILLAHELADVTWTRYEPGERGPGPHVHREHVDAFYVLEGELEFGVGRDGAEVVRAPAGTFVLVPPNVVHTFGNESGARALFLNVHAPSCGFAGHLRDETKSWDSFDPPEDGGRPAADAIVSGPDDGERFVRSNRTLVIKGAVDDISAIEISFDVSFEVSAHSHDDHVDSFFVLEGQVDFLVGDERHQAGPGSFAAAPPGAVHGFDTSDPDGALLLNIHLPDAGFADGIRNG